MERRRHRGRARAYKECSGDHGHDHHIARVGTKHGQINRRVLLENQGWVLACSGY